MPYTRNRIPQRAFRFPDFVKAVLALAVAGSMIERHVSAHEPLVQVQELTEANWDQFVPAGKEVDAIYGDIVLQNAHVRAVIAAPVTTRNANMTVRNVGGCLIDFTSRHHESDQLSAFFPGRRQFAFSRLEVGAEASSSAEADGKTVSLESGKVVVRSEGSDKLPACSVEYALLQDDRWLTTKSTWTNTTAANITLTPDDDLRADGGKEDMVKSPNGTHDVFWFHDIYWQQAYGVSATGFRIRCNSNARESVLAYEAVDGKPIVIKPGESFSLTRHVFVGRDLTGVLADFDEYSGRGGQLADVNLRVLAQGQPVAGARVAFRYGDTDRGTVVTDPEGTSHLRLPAGGCTTTVQVAGVEYAQVAVNIVDKELLEIELPGYKPGVARITVTDAEGRVIPAKVDFRGAGSTPTPNWGPETAEFFVRNLAYAPNGTVTTSLASGDYDVIISHGPEYDAEFTKLHVEPGKTAELSVKLPRSVSTPGWISTDFHSHSSPSGDNTSSQLGRVLNLAAEHVEFAPCTEHNRISSYDQHLESQGLKPFLATVTGMELTGSPLPLNHQNVFPLILRPRTQDGGAPVTDQSPETQMERVAAWDNNSVKLIQQNHPDIGWLFYDRNGDQVPDEGYSRSFGLMNVIEVHPVDRLLKPSRFEMRDGKPVGNETILNWLQLLNQGFRIYGVVNTDAHYNFHGSGGLRNWLKSATDDPSKINSDEMRDAARQGQIVMSNGPYLEASFSEARTDGPVAVSGQDLVAKSGKVNARIRVQCPNWFDVDTVIVLVNGRRHDRLSFDRDSHPEAFGKGSVKFQRTVDVELTEDAHLIVVTGHRTQVLGDIMGPSWGSQHPTAVSNPVYIDIEGDGFTANRDTLDIPLPVKFAAPK